MILLVFLLLLGFPCTDCTESFDKFIKTNTLLDKPIGDQAYLLELGVRTEFTRPINNRRMVEQKIVAIIHEDGFCVKTEDIINIGNSKEIYTIIPKARMIVKTPFHAENMPDVLQIAKYQKEVLSSAKNKSCELVEDDEQDFMKLSASFEEPLLVQQQSIHSIDYFLNAESFMLSSVVMKYAPNQAIKEQRINYLQFNTNSKKDIALTKSFIFKPDGSLKDEFLHFEILEK